MRLATLGLLMFGLLAFGSVAAQSSHQAMHHSQHTTHQQVVADVVQTTQAGQAAFAAIQEIVALLNTDPSTDWEQVNIDALRDHLLDMNALTLYAQTDTTRIDNGVTILATGSGQTLTALQRMVPAHMHELDKLAHWNTSAELHSNGVRLRVTSHESAEVKKIQALGFFGLMATGTHHQVHHLAIAKGMAMH